MCAHKLTYITYSYTYENLLHIYTYINVYIQTENKKHVYIFVYMYIRLIYTEILLYISHVIDSAMLFRRGFSNYFIFFSEFEGERCQQWNP